MNFFGHLTVATWYSREPALLLGAMLPDFAALLGAPAPTATSEPLARGLALHHDTDRAFHGAPSFVALSHEACRELIQAGLPRGAARAVAHIGVEIVLDGVLAETDERVSAYRAALAEASRVEPALSWRSLASPPAGRLQALCGWLAPRDIRHESRDPEVITQRLERTLASRPRLRIPPGDLRQVTAWVERTGAAVRREAGPLLAQVERGLAAHDPRYAAPVHRGSDDLAP
ncbi:MAG: hypothetical protein KIT72_00275 [Polyangiaceae bacterium]|nr:hypothetical protein [Polyangiaceae bacterium]MCW5788831.1 hypothetical protein [Polyangiaceae bacterium]